MRLLGTLCVLSLVTAEGLAGQAATLGVDRGNGSVSPVNVVLDRGYAAVPLSTFRDLGWTAAEADNALAISVPNEITLGLHLDSPFFTWDGLLLQLADPPYRSDGGVFVPLQLLTDFFPRRLPDLYEFDGARSLLRAGDPVPGRGGAVGGAPGGTSDAVAAPLPTGPSPYDGPRVVVIDAGHGGADPGALGPRGVREKDVALAVSLELARLLRAERNLEVHLTRDRDDFIDLWERGEIATKIKGDRPGVFVSVHANSFPNSRATRGFETYFLADARTEHERRVSAIENAPLSFQGQDVDRESQPDLDFILRELRNLDHQHWSALLAQLVQDELDDFHPGPNRGVKQGVLAVLTNALMPSILVEVGYLSHDEEGRLLGQEAFQRQAAAAVAEAVVRFFERYPPGAVTGGDQE